MKSHSRAGGLLGTLVGVMATVLAVLWFTSGNRETFHLSRSFPIVDTLILVGAIVSFGLFIKNPVVNLILGIGALFVLGLVVGHFSKTRIWNGVIFGFSVVICMTVGVVAGVSVGQANDTFYPLIMFGQGGAVVGIFLGIKMAELMLGQPFNEPSDRPDHSD